MPNLEEVRARFEEPAFYLSKPFGVGVRLLLVRRLLGQLEGARLLDIGCGDGSLSLQFASPTNRLTLIDLSGPMLELARSNVPAGLEHTVDFQQMDFRALNRTETYDIVLCVGVLAHVNSTEDAVKKVVSFAKPGGRVVFQITDGDAFVSRLHEAVCRLRALIGPAVYQTNPTNLEKFTALMREMNLKVIDQCRYSLLFPGMGKLPNKWLFRYQLASLERPYLSRFGMDVVLLVQKPFEESGRSNS